jgi:glycosyltransferase involved in cell wall biosynthesis
MTRRCRVLFVIAGLPAGGAERQLTLLLRGLDRASFEPGLLIFNAAEKIHYRDVFDTPLWFRALGLGGASATKLLWPILSGVGRAVRDFAPDVVYSTLNVANHTVRLSQLVLRWSAPIVTSVRVSYRDGYRQREKLSERLLWRRSAAIVCNAAATRDEMIADLGIDGKRLSVVVNGIDPTFFSSDALDLPSWWPQGRVALTLGRFSRQKNHLALIQALSLAARRQGLDDWSFVFVGEGPLHAAVRSAIVSAGLDGRILVRPPVAHPGALYRAAKLLIMPSLFEGMPNVALEAQASGCPVAITEAANRSGVVCAEDGFVLESDLAQSLSAVLRSSDQELLARGRKARLHMLAEFSVQKMIGRTQSLLWQVAGNAAFDSAAADGAA